MSIRQPLLEVEIIPTLLSALAPPPGFFGAQPATPRRAARAQPLPLNLVTAPFFERPYRDRLPILREFIQRASCRSDLEGRTEAAVVNVLDASREFLRQQAGAGGSELSAALAQHLGGAGAAAEPPSDAMVQGLLATAEAVRARARDHLRHGAMERALEDAVRRLEEEPPEAAAAFPHRDFSAGLQLLPETALQYRMPASEWFIAIDALTFGRLGELFLSSVRHTRVYLSNEVSEAGPQRIEYTAFRSVLEPCASFDKAFDSRAYIKALALRWVLWFVVACAVLLGCDAVIVTINLLEITTPSKNPFLFLNLFIFNIIDDIKRSMLDGAPPALPFAVGSFALMFLLCLSYVVLVASRSDVAAFVKAQEKDLPSSLSLVLRTSVPMLMLSYTWKAPFVDVARSLASACPNTWVDVQTLASGCDIPSVTSAVSRWSYAQVVFISQDYLLSGACLLELFTALLRRQSFQHLIVYYDARFAGEVEPTCLQLLEDIGCIVVRSARELLVQLDTRIYSCCSPLHKATDAKRALQWWSHVGVPLEAVPRQMLLPSPLAKRQRWLCNCCCVPIVSRAAASSSSASSASSSSPAATTSALTFLPPPGAIISGFRYISGNGLTLGSYWFLGLEFMYAAASGVAFIAGIAFIAVSVREMSAVGKALFWGTQYAIPPLLIVLALIWLYNGLSLSVLTDLRAYHSGLLLPLNVAASLNSLGVQSASDDAATKYSVTFLVSEASNAGLSVAERGGSEWAHLDASIDNMVHFLNEEVGLDTSRVAFEALAAAPAATRGIALYVFVLRSRAAVAHYLSHWASRISPSCSVIVADFRACEGTELTKSMIISLGPRNGLSAFSPYCQQGLVTAVFDSLGAKVGAAFVEHARGVVVAKAEEAAQGSPR